MPESQTATLAPPQLPEPKPAKRLALAALIVGIVAFLTGFVPFFGFLAGGTAVLLGLLALKRRQPKGLSITGIALGGVAALTSLIMTITLIADPPSLDRAAAPESVLLTVPDLKGMPGDEAHSALRELDLKIELVDATGEDRRVMSRSNWEVQSSTPEAGEEVEAGATVTLHVTKISDRKAAEQAAAEEKAAEEARAAEEAQAAEEKAAREAREAQEKAAEETAKAQGPTPADAEARWLEMHMIEKPLDFLSQEGYDYYAPLHAIRPGWEGSVNGWLEIKVQERLTKEDVRRLGINVLNFIGPEFRDISGIVFTDSNGIDHNFYRRDAPMANG